MEEASDEADAPPPLLGRHLAIPVGIFLASRAVTFAVAHAARVVEPQPLSHLLSRWDGAHYLNIVAHGYPATPPSGSGEAAQTVHAFFPGYPLLVRALRAATGLAPVPAGVVVNIAMATVAAAVIWLLARDLLADKVATRAVLLFSFFPGAYVLGMVYSEGTFLALAAGCLLALHRRQWLVAGLAAAAAGATRPTGLVLALCCAWAAVVALRRRREWLALVAPALAQECTMTTSDPEIDSGRHFDGAPRFYVINDQCAACGSLSLFMTWIYQESNGVDGLQRNDDVATDTCDGAAGPSDTLIW